ncbi:MAG TPA: KilA-N domain-containing protein [Clostridiaceae bacterium]|jgi:hypothetical protein|nr:KilA-N domain-containing protein [Clostridiaceae bacterium]
MKNELIKTKITVKDTPISVIRIDKTDFISLTDLAKYQNSSDPSFTVKNWLRRVSTIDYIGLWEQLHNTSFNLVEFDQIKTEYGKNSFAMSPSQWIKRTNSIGIIAKGGRYSLGTFAHPDIAFEFASWLSPEFKLYLITEFERLKSKESYQNKIEWSVKRELSKTNYIIHTDSIKEFIVPTLTEKQKQYAYANEADVLNVALFGMTAKEWRNKNPDINGNIRDYTDILHLVVLANLENLNAEMITSGIPQSERIIKLNNTAKKQLELLKNNSSIRKLEKMDSHLKLE